MCRGCGNKYPETDFPTFRDRDKDKTYHRWTCKPCGDAVNKAYRADWFKKNPDYTKNYKWKGIGGLVAQKKAIVDKAKSDPCVDCGNKFPAVAMDFDHVRGEKKAGIAQMVGQNWSVELLIKEMEKCELVCACCHRVRTAKRGRK